MLLFKYKMILSILKRNMRSSTICLDGTDKFFIRNSSSCKEQKWMPSANHTSSYFFSLPEISYGIQSRRTWKSLLKSFTSNNSPQAWGFWIGVYCLKILSVSSRFKSFPHAWAYVLCRTKAVTLPSQTYYHDICIGLESGMK